MGAWGVMSGISLSTACPEETLILGSVFGAFCAAGDVLALHGTLGAGKTLFTKGLAVGLGVEDIRQVISPTFILMRRHDGGRMPLYHFDAYRLHNGSEMEDIGADDAFAAGGVAVVEWADHVADCLPERRCDIFIRVDGDSHRSWRIEGAERPDDLRVAIAEAGLTLRDAPAP
jgi:tRNA threonylcarbamoyladenosine biosynthesis protein TsaE